MLKARRYKLLSIKRFDFSYEDNMLDYIHIFEDIFAMLMI